MNSYITFPTSRGLMLVNQQLAHERILFERLSDAVSGDSVTIQHSLFPASLTLAPADATLMDELIPELKPLGYLVEPFGKNTFLVQGTPADIPGTSDGREIENLLEAFKHFNPTITCTRREKLVRAMSARQCIKTGTSLSDAEMRNLISDLAACRQPSLSVGGLPTYVELGKDQIDSMFCR
jgi:DNA mismatch repair protein MutL